MPWRLFVALIVVVVLGNHAMGNEESTKKVSDYSTLVNLCKLPYETTVTLARRYNFLVPRVGEDPLTPLPLAADMKTSLGTAMKVPRGMPFFIFNTVHAKAADDLIRVFLNTDVSQLANVALQVRDYVNEAMFLFAFYHTFLERQELDIGDLPELHTVLPDRFVNFDAINSARLLVKAERQRGDGHIKRPIHVTWDKNETGLSARHPEHRVAYYRENIFLNVHHWHWHIANPWRIQPGQRDRRGELFYYMHHNMVGRYDMERLSVKLRPVEPFDDWRSPIPDGYFPHITSGNGFDWANRQDNTIMNDGISDPLSASTFVSQLELWRTHLYHSIDVGHLIYENNSQIALTDDPLPGEQFGIDLLGDTVEASTLSVNPSFYGSLHNLGHVLISRSHDPTQKHQSSFGVMTATETAVRDPVFFRWHKFIDNLFIAYKMTQPAYTRQQLLFDDVVVEEIRVVEDDNNTPKEDNLLHTFFTEDTFEISEGIDFSIVLSDNVTVFLTSSFLNHSNFHYEIKVNNKHYTPITPTVRIFIAPKFNEDGELMNYAQLQHYWSEMDVFVTDPLEPGLSTIYRESSMSSVLTKYHGPERKSAVDKVYPGCGWPESLLLPRGTSEGMVFRLFVMVTNATYDRIDHLPTGSLCGRPDAKYPDRWPMGYPLDRRCSHDTIDRFVDQYPNMLLGEIVIKHKN